MKQVFVYFYSFVHHNFYARATSLSILCGITFDSASSSAEITPSTTRILRNPFPYHFSVLPRTLTWVHNQCCGILLIFMFSTHRHDNLSSIEDEISRDWRLIIFSKVPMFLEILNSSKCSPSVIQCRSVSSGSES